MACEGNRTRETCGLLKLTKRVDCSRTAKMWAQIKWTRFGLVTLIVVGQPARDGETWHPRWRNVHMQPWEQPGWLGWARIERLEGGPKEIRWLGGTQLSAGMHNCGEGQSEVRGDHSSDEVDVMFMERRVLTASNAWIKQTGGSECLWLLQNNQIYTLLRYLAIEAGNADWLRFELGEKVKQRAYDDIVLTRGLVTCKELHRLGVKDLWHQQLFVNA